MSRNLFCEQISKPVGQLYVGSWKFHFLTSFHSNCMLVFWKYHFLTSFVCFPTVCWFVWKFTTALLLLLGKLYAVFQINLFDQCRWLSFVFEAVEPKKLTNFHCLFSVSSCGHMENFCFGNFFTSREGGRDHPLSKGKRCAMRQRGSPLQRGVVAFAAPLVLGKQSCQRLTFSTCNFILGFICAVIFIVWLLHPYTDE